MRPPTSLAGRSVLLKPNLVEYDPDTVINTDPRLAAATVLAVRRLGASSVVVAEGPPGTGATPRTWSRRPVSASA